MYSLFENLPNELIWTIFSYLSVVDVFHSFSNLNERLSSLVQTNPAHQLDFSAQILSKNEFLDLLRRLRPVPIHSLRLSNRDYVDGISLCTSYLSRVQFPHLRSLTLLDASGSQIERCLQQCSSLTALFVTSKLWRSLRGDMLPCLPTITHLHLPVLDPLNGSYPNVKHLRLDQCRSEHLMKLNRVVPNLQSLALVLTRDSTISQVTQFPHQLHSVQLTVRSVIFADLQHLLKLIGPVAKLRATITNSEYDVYPFDDYLLGDHWFSLCECIADFQFSVKIHRSQLTYHSEELRSTFAWYQRRVHCERIEATCGYHLFSLPYIDSEYTLDSCTNFDTLMQRKDFDRAQHLHLFDSEESINPNLSCLFHRLRKLTLMLSNPNETFRTLLSKLLIRNVNLRCVELHVTTTHDHLRSFIEALLRSLPSTVNRLILNQNSSILFTELLEEKDFFLTHVKRLECTLRNRSQLDTLLVFLLEPLEKRRLIQLKISLENASRLSDLLSGWVSKYTCLKTARTELTDRHFSIWI